VRCYGLANVLPDVTMRALKEVGVDAGVLKGGNVDGVFHFGEGGLLGTAASCGVGVGGASYDGVGGDHDVEVWLGDGGGDGVWGYIGAGGH